MKAEQSGDKGRVETKKEALTDDENKNNDLDGNGVVLQQYCFGRK